MVVSTKTLKILSQNDIIIFKADENLLDVLNANKVSINQSCGGNGSCTTCRIFIHEGLKNVTARTLLEAEIAEERDFANNERLACQTCLLDSVTIEIPEFDQD